MIVNLLQNVDASAAAASSPVYLAPELFAKLPVFVAPTAAPASNSTEVPNTSHQHQFVLETDDKLHELTDEARGNNPRLTDKDSFDVPQLMDNPSVNINGLSSNGNTQTPGVGGGRSKIGLVLFPFSERFSSTHSLL